MGHLETRTSPFQLVSFRESQPKSVPLPLAQGTNPRKPYAAANGLLLDDAPSFNLTICSFSR